MPELGVCIRPDNAYDHHEWDKVSTSTISLTRPRHNWAATAKNSTSFFLVAFRGKTRYNCPEVICRQPMSPLDHTIAQHLICGGIHREKCIPDHPGLEHVSLVP